MTFKQGLRWTLTLNNTLKLLTSNDFLAPKVVTPCVNKLRWNGMFDHNMLIGLYYKHSKLLAFAK